MYFVMLGFSPICLLTDLVWKKVLFCPLLLPFSFLGRPGSLCMGLWIYSNRFAVGGISPTALVALLLSAILVLEGVDITDHSSLKTDPENAGVIAASSSCLGPLQDLSGPEQSP
jgi:hypothetical protein